MKGLFLFLLACLFLIIPGRGGEDRGYFPVIADWIIAEEIQTFDPETLFEYINGAADLFLIYDFQEVKVATYFGESNNGEIPEIDVEVYDQKSSVNAYGMYSQERPSKPDFAGIGSQAYKEGSILNFISGKYYVKIDSHDNSEKTRQAITLIAQKLAKNLCDNPVLPELLGVFPENEKIASSDMYISKDFLGHRFLTDVYRTDYQGANKKYSLFLITKENSEDCMEIVKKYHDFCKKPINKIEEGEYKLSDRYNGEILINWGGKYVWGILSKEKMTKASDKIKYLEENLKDLNLIE